MKVELDTWEPLGAEVAIRCNMLDSTIRENPVSTSTPRT